MRSGPDAVEVLEFRGRSQFDIQFSESEARWDVILEEVRQHRDDWDTMSKR